MRLAIRRHGPTFLVCSLLCVLAPWRAQAGLTQPNGSAIKFTASGPGGLTIVGRSDQLRASDDGHPLDDAHDVR